MCIVVALQFLGQCGFPFNRRDVLTLLNSKNANLKIKRKRAQSKTGEILTKENVLERLAAEERDLKNKFNQIEVEYRSRSQSSKFIGQVIDINEFYHIKYLTKSPLGDYYTFPAIDDEDRVEFSDVCRIQLEPNFDSPVDIISLIK
ncbi:uncharacterized protein TNCV_68101 [Trichonephila clavipes]|nr:uncharacterized protein TNCV_68101 [Trichonephila clavipes]